MALHGLDTGGAPAADKAKAMLDEIDGSWWNVYMGGPRSGGSDWTPARVKDYVDHGIRRFILTYVGRQILLNIPHPVDDTHLLTKAQGRNDGDEACQIAADFGYSARGTPICLDLEGETFERARQRAVDYVRGWCGAVRDHGLRPGVYSNIPALIALQDDGPDWIWVAKWITNKVDPDVDPHAIPDLDRNVFPNAGQRAWQYAGEFKKDKPAVVGGLRVDISVADADCLAQAPGIIPEEELSMADAGDILSFLQEMKQEMVVFGTTGLEKTVEDFATRQRQALAKLDQLDTRLTKIEQHLNMPG